MDAATSFQPPMNLMLVSSKSSHLFSSSLSAYACAASDLRRYNSANGTDMQHCLAADFDESRLACLTNQSTDYAA